MPYFSLVFLLLSLTGLLPPPSVAVQTRAIAFQESDGQDFWPSAQRLAQEQMDTIARIEKAIASSDARELAAAREQLILHLAAIDRFLKSRYYSPNLVCQPSRLIAIPKPGAGITEQQKPVYCALYTSTQTLTPLIGVFDERRQMLAAPAPSKPSRSSALPSIGTEEPNLAVPVAPRPELAPSFPPAEPPIIGFPAKQPLADYSPPLQPALAPQWPVLPVLAAAKRQLAQMRAAFPPGTEFVSPDESAPVSESEAKDESELYAEFQALPNTGIARVLPAEANRLPARRNRLSPPAVERIPFPPLFEPVQEEEFTPRLAIEIVEGQFQIVMSDLDYGFVVDLGDVSLEKLAPDSGVKLSPAQSWFFLKYQPPDKLDELQVDRRRFLTGKLDDFVLPDPVRRERKSAAQLRSAAVPAAADRSNIPSVRSSVPVVLNHTYLMRSFQFEVPEIILNNQPIYRRQRRYLSVLLNMPSCDLLIAFRPVIRRDDGSYTVLWRVLSELPQPQIRDLYRYVDFY